MHSGKLSGQLIFALSVYFIFSMPISAQINTIKPTPLTPGKRVNVPTISNSTKKPSLPSKPETKLDAPPSVQGRTPLQINVKELGEIDKESVGILLEEQGGLGIDMWAGTNRAFVESALPKLPVNLSSRTLRSLMRRLLLSSAKSPETESTNSTQKTNVDEKKGNLLAIRIKQLFSMGEIDAVYKLIGIAPNRHTDPVLLESEVDVLFLLNDNSRACDLVMRQIRHLETPYWQKALIYCQALSGNYDKANLGASLLRETGEQDKVFFGLLNSLVGIEDYILTALPQPKPLYFSMIRAAKIKLSKEFVTSISPVVLRTIAVSPNAEAALRIDAAENAEAMGVLDIEVLRQIYQSISFAEGMLNETVSKVVNENSPLGRALIYRKVLMENVALAKAEILNQVFRLSRGSELYEQTSRLYRRTLKNLAVADDLMWFAPVAVRALLAAGDRATADLWLKALREGSANNREIMSLYDQVYPLARLTGLVSDEDWDAIKLKSWWEITKPNKKGIDEIDQAHARAAVLYNLLEAQGDKIPSTLWETLLHEPMHRPTFMPNPALWQILNEAVVNQRRGEAVLAILLTLGNFRPAQLNPLVLRQVIVSLDNIGLTSEARSVALEVAIANGL